MDSYRLDRFLCECGIESRSTAKELLRKKKVFVNGILETRGERKVTPETDQVICSGKALKLIGMRYYLYNKPCGEVSATTDAKDRTVLDAFGKDGKDLFPVGRLDKDTEGLLIITNDGELSHLLMSPAKHVAKTYEVTCEGIVTNEQIKELEEGIVFQEFTTKPAHYEFCSYSEATNQTLCLLTIFEGKFHQVKRMFRHVGNPVLELKRQKIGGLSLPEELSPGEYSEIDKDELLRKIYG